MALESWTVMFDFKHAGAGTQIGFKNQTEVTGGLVPTETARVATLNAGSAQEAATGVRKAFGEGLITGKCKVVKTSSLEEKSA
jgi:hypothetical protein